MRSCALILATLYLLSGTSLNAQHISGVEIVADSSVKTDFEYFSKSLEGTRFSEAALSGFANDLLSALENSGYPFAQVHVRDVMLSDGEDYELVVEVISGPLCRFDSARVTGVDARTKVFLERLATVSPGERFDQSEIERTLALYRQFPFLKVADSAKLQFFDDFTTCIPTFEVQRKPTNLVEGSLGYQPGFADRDGYLQGFVRIEFENLLGRGRRFEIAYNKRNPLSHRVRIGFYQPYILYQPLSLGISVEQQRFDSLYQELSADASVSYNEFGPVSVRVRAGWQRFTPEGSRFIGVFHVRRWWWGVGVTLSTERTEHRQVLDIDLLYGTKQKYSFAGIRPEQERIDDTRLESTYRGSFPLYAAVSSAVRIDAAGIITDETDVPQTDLYKLGGARTLRGYREDQFLTERFLLASVQPNVRLATGARFHVFADGATFKSASGESLERFGAGAGFVFDLPYGSLLIDAAWGEDDDLSDGKLYMILESRF